MTVLAAAGSVPAFADEAACGCAMQSQATGPIGSVTSASGNVLVSQTAGYIAAEKGSELAVGSRVITGVKSEASVRLASGCGADLGANSSATIVRQGDKLCLQVTKPETTAAAEFSSAETTYGQAGGGGGFRFGFPELFFGAALGTSVGGFVFDDRDDDDGASDQ